jgi:hypothetical protein
MRRSPQMRFTFLVVEPKFACLYLSIAWLMFFPFNLPSGVR